MTGALRPSISIGTARQFFSNPIPDSRATCGAVRHPADGSLISKRGCVLHADVSSDPFSRIVGREELISVEDSPCPAWTRNSQHERHDEPRPLEVGDVDAVDSTRQKSVGTLRPGAMNPIVIDQLLVIDA